MKRIIYSDKDIYNSDARAEYVAEMRAELGDPNYEVSDEECQSLIEGQFEDELYNLDKDINKVIIAFASLGRWNGRVQVYKIVGSNIKDILNSGQEYNEWFGDGYNIRSTHTHHDGTNYVLYRVVDSTDKAERIAEQIYNNEIDEVQFRKKTRSLYPFVADIYGWTAKRFNKNKTLNKK